MRTYTVKLDRLIHVVNFFFPTQTMFHEQANRIVEWSELKTQKIQNIVIAKVCFKSEPAIVNGNSLKLSKTNNFPSCYFFVSLSIVCYCFVRLVCLFCLASSLYDIVSNYKELKFYTHSQNVFRLSVLTLTQLYFPGSTSHTFQCVLA